VTRLLPPVFDGRRDDKYACPIQRCNKTARGQVAPSCPQHKVPMEKVR
jgi:hypothetical protein